MTDDVLPRNVSTRRFLDAWAQGDLFRPLEPETRIVQFGRALTEAELAKAGRLIAERPDVWLRVHLGESADLDFLKHFPGLRHLDLEIFELNSIEGYLMFEATSNPSILARRARSFRCASLPICQIFEISVLAVTKRTLRC